MKYLLTIFTLISTSIYAAQVGDINHSFNSDEPPGGWVYHADFQNFSTNHIIGDMVYNHYYPSTYAAVHGIHYNSYVIYRYDEFGEPYTNFGLGGVLQLGQEGEWLDELNVKMAVHSSSSMLAVARKHVNITGAGNDYYIRLETFDESGQNMDSANIDFDDLINFSGEIWVRDIAFNPLGNQLVVVLEIQRNNAGDTDVGLVLYDLNHVGWLTEVESFGDNGRQVCYHDLGTAPVNALRDAAASVVWSGDSQSFIVGATAFDDNGSNQAFCEYSVSGSLVNKWNSQADFIFATHQEHVSDMLLIEDGLGGMQLMVAGAFSGDGGLDYSLTRYNKVAFDQWQIDSSFGNSGSVNVGFYKPNFILDPTNDQVVSLVQQKNGAFILAGNSSWEEAGESHSQFNLAAIDVNGELYSQWGQQNGTATVNYDSSSPREIMYKMVMNPFTEDIYVAGSKRFPATSQHSSFTIGVLGKVYNDLIFDAAFE